MNEYPKALYKGDTVLNAFAIADDAEREAELRDYGYVDYKDLPQGSEQLSYSPVMPAIMPLPENELELELNAALIRIDELERELEEKAQANADTGADVDTASLDALEAENAELKKRLRAYEVNDLSADELRAILDGRNIEYGARDNKPTLVEAVLKSE